MNKDLKNIDIKGYFKKIGKKNTIRLFSFSILIVLLILFIFQVSKNGQMDNAELKESIQEKETEELTLLKDKKEEEEIHMLLKEYEKKITDEDIHEHTLESLDFFEQLFIQYSLNNYLHEVDDLEVVSSEDEDKEDEEYIHITLGLEGEFENIMKFIEDIKQSDHPILLENTQFIIDEEEYPEEYDFDVIKAQLDINVYEENLYVERSEEIFFDDEGIDDLLNEKGAFDEDDKDDDVVKVPSLSPFGMYSFEIEEEESDSYDEYQDFLQGYLEDIEGNDTEDENNDYETEEYEEDDSDEYEANIDVYLEEYSE